MSENFEINFEEIQNNENKNKTEKLWGQANSILSAFKSRFGENSDQYKEVLESYQKLFSSIQKAQNEVKDQTSEEAKELRDYIDNQEFTEITTISNSIYAIFLESDLKLSSRLINNMSESEIVNIPETIRNNMFNYYLNGNEKNLSFINNANYIELFLKYTNEGSHDEIDYSNIYANLSPAISKNFNIIKYFVAYDSNISYISKDFLNNKNNLVHLMENDLVFKIILTGMFDTEKELFYKKIFTKVTNDDSLEYIIDYCIEKEGIKIYDYIDKNIYDKYIEKINKKIKEKGIQAQKSSNFLSIENIDNEKFLNGKPITLDILTTSILDNNNLENFDDTNIESIIETIETYEKSVKLDTKNDVINFLNNKNNKQTIFNIINDYILVKGTKSQEIKNDIFNLLTNGNYSDLYSIQNNKEFLKEYLKTPNSNLGIVKQFSADLFDQDMLNLIIEHRNFELASFFISVKIDSLEKLQYIYNQIIKTHTEISKTQIIGNPIFSEYINLFDKKFESELGQEFLKLNSVIGKYLSELHYTALVNNKDKVISIIKQEGIQGQDIEATYRGFLEASKGINEAKNIYPELLKSVGGDVEKLKKIHKEIKEELSFYLADLDGDINKDFNTRLKGIDLNKLRENKPQINNFFIGDELNTRKVLDIYENFKKQNPIKQGEDKSRYEWLIRNKFIESLGFNKNLSLDESIFKEVLFDITKIKELDSKLKQDIATQDTYFKYLSGEIKEADYLKKVEEYNKEQELKESGNTFTQTIEQVKSSNSLIPEITKTQNGYNFTTTTQAGEKLELPITPYEANLINGNKEIKENFKKFSETLSELNLLNLWTYREGIFKAISEVKGIAFNANDDFLKEEEVKLFLVSVISSISNNLTLENQQKLGVNSSFDSELIDPSYIKNKKLNELKTDIRNINVIGKGKDSATGYSPIENEFIKTFTNESNRGQFLQDKFKQYI